MRPRIRTALAAALALAAATVATALPAGAGAKGVAALRVCGADGCHPVDAAAVRAGFERFSDAPTPDGAEPFFTIRARARVSSGRLADVFALDWLPRAGVTRPSGESLWTRPAPVLATALRRAARGLTPKPAAELGSVYQAAPAARVVETYAPAATAEATSTKGGGVPETAIVAPAALVLLAAAGLAARHRRAHHP